MAAACPIGAFHGPLFPAPSQLSGAEDAQQTELYSQVGRGALWGILSELLELPVTLVN